MESSINNFDITTKKVISVLYRVLIIFYSIVIVFKTENTFADWIYYVSIIPYFIIYLSLIYKKGLLSLLRLLNDLLFSSWIVYGLEIMNPIILFYLLLPSLNNVNHSSNNRKSLFSVFLLVLTILQFYILNNFTLDRTIIFILLTSSMLSSLYFLRVQLLKIYTDLHESIENAYISNVSIYSTHKLLKTVIELIKENYFVNNLCILPSNIICLRILNNKLRFRSSAKFITTISLNEPEFIDNILNSKKRFLKNISIVIDGKDSKDNVSLLINEIEGFSYVYIIPITKHGFALDFYVQKILKPLLLKISRVVNLEEQLKLERNRYLDNIKSKMQFVSSTIQAVHFLNNKFTPLSNYFNLTEKIKEFENNDPKKSDLLNIIERERQTASNTLPLILNRFDDIRQKSLNPYLVPSFSEFSMYKVFGLVRKVWEEQDLDKNKLSNFWDRDCLSLKIRINLDSYEYLIEEWLLNISKHTHTDDYNASFIVEEKRLVLMLSNRIKSFERNKQEYITLCQEFNQEIPNEVMKRKSYGISFVKQFLIQLNIEHQLNIVNETLVLKLTFNTYENRNN